MRELFNYEAVSNDLIQKAIEANPCVIKKDELTGQYQARTKSIDVQVTQEDIDKGSKNEGESCAIAQALTRIKTNDSTMVYVTPNGIKVRTAVAKDVDVHCTGFTSRDDLPSEVLQFIRDFDDGKPVQPFSFKLKSVPVHF